MKFNTIEEALKEIQNGRPIVVIDDEDRENEGDLVMAAEKITPDAINFMISKGRGLVCMPMTGERVCQLNLHQMTTKNTESKKTAFTVSVDASSKY